MERYLDEDHRGFRMAAEINDSCECSSASTVALQYEECGNPWSYVALAAYEGHTPHPSSRVRA